MKEGLHTPLISYTTIKKRSESMIPNKKIFGMMVPGDYVKIKTVGQLIDTGW